MRGHLTWYMARSAGLVAWALLAASMLWGLALSSRVLGRRPPQGRPQQPGRLGHQHHADRLRAAEVQAGVHQFGERGRECAAVAEVKL